MPVTTVLILIIKINTLLNDNNDNATNKGHLFAQELTFGKK
jgi:hypothetical protein